MTTTRRDFLATLLATSAAGVVSAKEGLTKGAPTHPVLIGSANALPHLEAAHTLVRNGGDTLDAAVAVCTALENDPTDNSVGYGGLPNEDGEVELDACVMHGPSRRAGAVAGLRRIKNAARLAQTVMERTDHLTLVADGARRFAVAHGFPEESLLTEHARKTWLLWKETMSRRDSWGSGLDDPSWDPPKPAPERSSHPAREALLAAAARIGIEPALREEAVRNVLVPPTGTVHCSVVNGAGDISGATSTSGLAWKIPGRIGDSPIIGAGCFTDPDVGSAGATGRGEECVKIAGAHTVVENLRRGMSPEDACREALERIVRNYRGDRDRLRYVSMTFYALRRDGAFAGVSMWSRTGPENPRRFAVHDGTARLEAAAYLFDGAPVSWPPVEEVERR
jgi:N4-(beta-N-acetylglucosaminyl)-L-asparaginase